MKSDATKIKDPVTTKIVADIQEYEGTASALGGPYIRSIGYYPFTCSFFGDFQIDYMKSQTDDPTCFVDFTGETFPMSSKKSKEKTRRALQFSISMEGSISVADLLTEKATTVEIIKFLATWKAALKKKIVKSPKNL